MKRLIDRLMMPDLTGQLASAEHFGRVEWQPRFNCIYEAHAAAIARWGDADAVVAWSQALNPRVRARLVALSALGRLPSARSVEHVGEGLKRASKKVLPVAFAAMARQGEVARPWLEAHAGLKRACPGAHARALLSLLNDAAFEPLRQLHADRAAMPDEVVSALRAAVRVDHLAADVDAQVERRAELLKTHGGPGVLVMLEAIIEGEEEVRRVTDVLGAHQEQASAWAVASLCLRYPMPEVMFANRADRKKVLARARKALKSRMRVVAPALSLLPA